MHDLAGLHRVRLLDGDDAAVVEDALERHVDVDDLRLHLLQERQEDALRRLGEEAVLHRRLADDGCRVDGILAVRDGRDVEDRVVVGEGVVARVVAERPLAAHLVRAHITLEDDLSRGRHLDVDRLALDHLDRLVAQEAREDHLVDVARQRCRRRVRHDRVRADGDSRLDARAALRLHVAEVLRAVLMDVPVHARRLAVVLL